MTASEPLPDIADATPVMAQYLDAKRRYPDALLFFRMGDFYELFFDDAVIAARVLGIALTRRGKHGGQDIPMAGVPMHALDGYLARLVTAGHRVAICEQLEDPAEAKKRGYKAVVRRDVVRVVTPGTLTEDPLLDARAANRLLAVVAGAVDYAVATLELSAGRLDVLRCGADDLGAHVSALVASEILLVDQQMSDPALRGLCEMITTPVQPRPRSSADPRHGAARLRALYGVATLDGFGDFAEVEISALGLIADYLHLTQPGQAVTLLAPRRLADQTTLAIDPATRASLEIDRVRSGGREGSLMASIDRTVTGPGARVLADRLMRPLLDLSAIAARHDSIGFFLERAPLCQSVRTALAASGDLERAVTRVVLGRGGPRDLGVVRDTLGVCDQLIGQLSVHDLPPELADCRAALSFLTTPALFELWQVLRATLADALPQQARDGGFVRRGADPALDEICALRDDSRRVIAAMEQELAHDTGLSSLKIRHNSVLGYFIEVSARQADVLMQLPHSARFIHRQTLANQVRFTTPDLADLDARISQAADRALARERAIFDDLCAQITTVADALRAAATGLATLDVATALAVWSQEVGACRPVVDDTVAFQVSGGRHPVVAQALMRTGAVFTPNDCRLDGLAEGGPRLALITGPNMAGKSTFLRQNALMAILAQAGCYVPATSARIGCVDRLFSRVGAADDLARGQSTFMAEMVETAAILTQATARSFVILDEIGRGTATYDGLAIAWAVSEYLHGQTGCRTLFATHYHELAQLEGRLAGVQNWHLKAREWKGDLVFLHEVAMGAADRSYGIQVARLAGVPRPVLSRAEAVLRRLEKSADGDLGDLPLFDRAAPAEAPVHEPHPVVATLARIDPDALSPKAALEALYHLKGLS